MSKKIPRFSLDELDEIRLYARPLDLHVQIEIRGTPMRNTGMPIASALSAQKALPFNWLSDGCVMGSPDRRYPNFHQGLETESDSHIG